MADITGTNGDDILSGLAGADKIDGGGGNDMLFGEAGNDILQGGSGTNTLAGGLGNDIYVLEAGALDTVVESANEGTDEIRANFNIALGHPLLQHVENLTFIGNIGLIGSGNALANTMIGGNGGDLLMGVSGNDKLNGALGDDQLIGGSGNDALSGGDGSDMLDGSDGNDTMTGGKGDDTYYVDSAGDKVVEKAGEGVDIVHSTVTYALAANVEDLNLGDTANINGAGNALDNEITGNSGANRLDGGAGNDTLKGGGGKDTLLGGTGDDHYYIDSTDTIIESAGGGIDSIHVGFNVDLASLANVENVFLEGAAYSAAGNAANNRIEGTGGANVLDGQAGNDLLFGFGGDDLLIGGAGNDWLDGGAGIDRLEGGAGNDVYFLPGSLDTIVELQGGGIDEIQTGVDVDLKTATLQNIENVTFISKIGRIGHGSDGANVMIGGTAGDVLIGAGGNDKLDGGYGNDRLRGDEGNDALYGGVGDDTLDGGTGNDTMTGGIGNDTYVLDSLTDKLVENPGEGAHDTVQSVLESTTLLANFEDLVLMIGAVNGTGNAVANEITGNGAANKLNGGSGDDSLRGGVGDDRLIGGAGNDTLDGGTGNDILEGGAGNDTYVLAEGDNDMIVEAANGGIDTVKVSAATFTLGDNIENCVVGITGAKATTITGNALHNALIGNVVKDSLYGKEGNDRLDGGAGADFLDGGDGNDILEGNLGHDNLKGGAGADIFLYRLDNKADLGDLSDAIIDFEHGKDKIDISDVFDDFGITSTNPIADGYLIFEIDRTQETYIMFDADGAAGAGAAVNLVFVAGERNATFEDVIF